MQGCIYLITNLVNGKKYVGQSSNPNSKDRFKTHIYDYKKLNRKTPLYEAMREFGKNNFICETLCVCRWESLNNLEAYYAEQYGTYVWDDNPGYNLKLCGISGNPYRYKYLNLGKLPGRFTQPRGGGIA
jgi:group I intron endonuclease